MNFTKYVTFSCYCLSARILSKSSVLKSIKDTEKFINIDNFNNIIKSHKNVFFVRVVETGCKRY